VPRRQVSFEIPATLHEISILGEALRAFRAAPTGEPVSDWLDLGVIEALNNVVEHGHPPGTDASIAVSYKEYDHRLVVEIRDRGAPVPPWRFESSTSDPFDFDPADNEDLAEGGRGFPLIRALFDGIEYMRVAGENRLRLTRTLIASPDQAVSPTR
jgi:serine/threonine-protein kinase RsbW